MRRSTLRLAGPSAVVFWLLAGASAAPPEPGASKQWNPITLENRRAGVPASEWDVANGQDDPNLLGFADDISYAPGELVSFRIHATSAARYSLRIYRVGWYGGEGARHVTTRVQNAPTSQPACMSLADPVDCSNWSVTDLWHIPEGQVSGVYLAKITPIPAGASNGSHILLVIRDDDGGSDILFQTDDTTWQAYNPYPSSSKFTPGVRTSLYNGAARVSYNRPIRMVVNEHIRSFFGAQYHMVRFLERNGYDVSYFAGVDAARRGGELLEHRVFLSSGHDEYWSREMRNAVNAARDAGTHLVFLSGNLMFWKTRWENGFRTMVSYKTTKHETTPPESSGLDDTAGFTGTWRDVRFQDPFDLAEPENSTTGLQAAVVSRADAALLVPEAHGQLRLWRNTPAAAVGTCNVTQLANNTLGFEWDLDENNGRRPPGLFRLSSTTLGHAPLLYGPGTQAAGSSRAHVAQATHHVASYRHASGALVFDAGSVQWSLGLDRTHLGGALEGNLDTTLAQATANLLADMGVQPDTPIDFSPAQTSTDHTPPVSEIISPANSASVRVGEAVEVTGTAGDTGGGVVAGVELSFDGGSTWRPVDGRESWRAVWRPAAVGTHVLMSRAVDDSGNLEPVVAAVDVSVGCPSPCSVWPASEAPAVPHQPDNPIELGVRFRADVSGAIRAIRFFADAASPGPHQAHLWSSTGALIGTATSPLQKISGWREAVFAVPVTITANTTYVASYHTTTGYAYTNQGLSTAWYRQPLAALGGGGVYAYGSGPAVFPTQTAQNRNYWIDVDFLPTGTGPRRTFHANPAPAVANHFDASAAADPWGVELGVRFRATVDGVVTAIHFYRASDDTEQIVNLWRDLGASHLLTPEADQPGNGKGLILASGMAFAGTGTGWQRVPLAQPVPILAGAEYVASYHTRNRYAYTANYFTAPVSDPPLIAELGVFRYGKTAFPEDTTNSNNYWVDVEFLPNAPFEHTLWPEAAVPRAPQSGDLAEQELGVRFTPEVAGFVEGIRFYKHPSNGGAHSGTLWTDTGAKLSAATFTNESSCGWQEVRFATPVPVSASAVYVASYHTTTGHAFQSDYFRDPDPNVVGSSWRPPLRALGDGEGGAGNGVKRLGPPGFPSQSGEGANYWVDVIFRSAARPVNKGPTPVPAYAVP
jgi:hypothetical protein